MTYEVEICRLPPPIRCPDGYTSGFIFLPDYFHFYAGVVYKFLLVTKYG